MKKYISLFLILTLIFSFTACQINNKANDTEKNPGIENQEKTIFKAEIIEIYDNDVIVKPEGNSNIAKSSDKISISKEIFKENEVEIGDMVSIEFNGIILESYPAQLGQVFSVELLDNEHQEEYKQLIKFNNKLYFNTFEKSKHIPTCGVMDGIVTSTVERNEIPEENCQSNFGTGYQFQGFIIEETLQVLIDNIWYIFATENSIEDVKIYANNDLSARNTELKQDIHIYPLEAIKISRLINNANFIEGTTDCLAYTEITLNGNKYMYHNDCGSLNDFKNNRHIILQGEEKEIFDHNFNLYGEL